MKGIGSRLERIVNVELFWHGAIMPRHPSLVNQRTIPLQFFCDTRRLKTLVIHVQELDERRTRRKYEIQGENENSGVPYDGSGLDLKDSFKVLMENTRIQPNHRQYRSIRTMHGLDFIYQLREMTYVRIREAQGKTVRQNIRDWSAVDDINSVVTRRKEPDYAFASELENLSPIGGLGNFVPTEDDKQIVRRWYADNDPIGDIVGDDDDGDTISVMSSEARSTPSVNGGGDNDSGVDVEMDDGNLDPNNGEDVADLGGPENDSAIDDINDGIDQVDLRDDSESVDEDAEDDSDNVSTTTDSSGDSDDSSRPHNTQVTGITSDYSTAANYVSAGQSSRRRASTVSSSTADAGDDAGDLGVIDVDQDNASGSEDNNSDNDENGEDEINEDEDGEDENDAADSEKGDGGSESSSMFVPQDDDRSSLFVRSDRASTYFKTDTDEEKHKIIDLTSDDNAGPSRLAAAVDESDGGSTEIKDESSGPGPGPSRPGPSPSRAAAPLAGSSLNVPMEIDEDDNNNKPSQETDRTRTLDYSDVESVSSSWRGGPSPSVASSIFKRRCFSPYAGSENQRSPKRLRTETPSESGASASEAGTTPDTPISIED
ncbi:hypothetical protein PG994_006254 [Apiospora phragmitis]|uniref:Uncharacterized protein n=1 Tax=Apiospora phragmitis TaxID=2905665 RepID=A0ABR1VEL8_9PEZI